MKRFSKFLLLITAIASVCAFAACKPEGENSGKPDKPTYTLSKTSLTIEKEASEQLTVASSSATDEFSVVWDSLDDSIATVSENGLVTGVAVGKTDVTAAVNGVTLTCKVSVTNKLSSIVSGEAETTVLDEACQINLTSSEIKYWEHYGDEGKLDYMLNAYDIITENTVEELSDGITADYGYKASMNWSNGSVNASWIGNGNNIGRSSAEEISFKVDIPQGESEIRVYFGATKVTGTIEVWDGEGFVAYSDDIVSEEGMASAVASFKLNATEDRTVTVKLVPSAAEEGGKITLVAVAVLGEGVSEAPAAEVTLNKVLMNDCNYDRINLTERGDLDWYYAGGNRDKKLDGAVIKDSSVVANLNRQFDDYKAAFSWTNGTLSATSPASDSNCSTGVNDGIWGDYVRFNVAVNPAVKTITVWAGGFSAEYYVEVIDSNGNVLLNSLVSEQVENTTVAYELNLLVNVTANDTLTVIVYRAGGVNCSIAAIAASSEAYAPAEYTLKESSAIVKGDSETLEVIASKDENVFIKWTSSDTDVAVVNDEGVVTAVGAGEAEIKAWVRGQELVCSVKVFEYTLNKENISLKEGETEQLTVTSNPVQDELEVVWSSIDSAVATVDPESGLVTAVKSGQTVIKAVVGGKTLECAITVTTDTVYSINHSSASLDLHDNNTIQLAVETDPVKDDLSVTWTSADNSIATVDANGLVTAVTLGGPVVISAEVDGYTFTCSVTVENKLTATSEKEDITAGRIDDITNSLYWEYYGSGSAKFDYKKNSEDIIDASEIEKITQGAGDYKVSINWTNGANNITWTGNGNTGLRCINNAMTLTVNVPAGESTITLYEGAWKATNVTELYDDTKLIATADSFTGGTSSVNAKIVFTVTTDIAKTLTVKITPTDKLENDGNCSIVAVAVNGTPSVQPTTAVTVGEIKELIPSSDADSLIDLTAKGTIDWYYANCENEAVEKETGTAISNFQCGNNEKKWDYFGLFTWSDGTKLNNFEDNDLGASYGDLKGSNNAICGPWIKFDVAVDADTNEIMVYAGGWNNTSFIEVIDSHGNVLVNQEAFRTTENAARAIRLSVSASVAETLTVVVYRTTGGNAYLSAITVS